MTETIIHLHAADSLRRSREPVTCGVPFPKGMLKKSSGVQLLDAGSQRVPLQKRILDTWSDGSALAVAGLARGRGRLSSYSERDRSN